MDIALPSFILGYHGCDKKLADAVIAGKAKLDPSTNDYDWLGEGIYFWEHNAKRAYDFAVERKKRKHPSGQQIKTPAVIGAVIDLGYCLNLLDTSYIALVKQAHQDLVMIAGKSGDPLPRNAGGRDLVDRKLDCAVIRQLHINQKNAGQPDFDTLRAAFFEGKPLYDNAGFAANTHIQIAVRTPAQILGTFHPLDEKGNRRRFK